MEPHANLFETLTEFYELLVKLAVIPPEMLKFPDPHTGDANFNVDAALEAGYTPEAVRLMARLPYLDIDSDILLDNEYYPFFGDLEIMHSTHPISFVGNGEEEAEYFEWMRRMDDDPMPDDSDYVMPGTHIRLSNQNIHGLTFIYDIETCLMREWKPSDNPDDRAGYDWITPKLPSEVLGPWISKYRNMEIIRSPERIVEPAVMEREFEESPPRNIFHAALRNLTRGHMRLEHMYYACGWDVESIRQPLFDRERFLQMRSRYQQEILQYLEESESEAFEEVREGERLHALALAF